MRNDEDFNIWPTILVLVMIYFAAILFKGRDREKEMMNQCLADGHKEYECYGMVRGSKR